MKFLKVCFSSLDPVTILEVDGRIAPEWSATVL